MLGRLREAARGRNIAALLLVYLLIQGAILLVDAQLPTGHILEFANLRSPDDVYSIIDQYSDGSKQM